MWNQRYQHVLDGPPIGDADCNEAYMSWYTFITPLFHSRHGGVFHTLWSVLGEFEHHMCEDISEQSRRFRRLLDTYGRVNLRSLGGPQYAHPPAHGMRPPRMRRPSRRRWHWNAGVGGRQNIPQEEPSEAGVQMDPQGYEAKHVEDPEPEAQLETPPDQFLRVYCRGSLTIGMMSFSPQGDVQMGNVGGTSTSEPVLAQEVGAVTQHSVVEDPTLPDVGLPSIP